MQSWAQTGPFFVKSGVSKRAMEVSSLLPSCPPVIVADYASISLNMPKCP